MEVRWALHVFVCENLWTMGGVTSSRVREPELFVNAFV